MGFGRYIGCNTNLVSTGGKIEPATKHVATFLIIDFAWWKTLLLLLGEQ